MLFYVKLYHTSESPSSNWIAHSGLNNFLLFPMMNFEFRTKVHVICSEEYSLKLYLQSHFPYSGLQNHRVLFSVRSVLNLCTTTITYFLLPHNNMIPLLLLICRLGLWLPRDKLHVHTTPKLKQNNALLPPGL